MKFGIGTALLLPISLLPVCFTAQDKDSVGPHSSQMPEGEKGRAKRVIEYKVAGLRPGRDAIEKAYSRFHKDRVIKELSPPGSAVWMDPCTRQKLTVAFDTNGTIREIGIEPFSSAADCSPVPRSVRAQIGGTGRGLVFRDSCNRIQEIYGKPQSQGRSVDGDNEFVYRFDRAIPGNSLSLELACNSVRNDVESIKLTASEKQ